MNNYSNFIMANIKDIEPNPLNPRIDNTIKTEELQRVIKDKGWAVPITCYQKDNKYIILSGHRRWYAAKKLMQKKIPVYLVEAPKSVEEEQERLGSVQGGKSDWSVYEWAKHTYDMWIYWEKCSFSELARKMNKSVAFVSARVKVFSYYPHSEIDQYLTNNKISISALACLIQWLNNLIRVKPEIVENHTLDTVRTTMLSKIERGLVGILDLKADSFIYKANIEHLKNFLKDPDKKLSDALLEIDGDSTRYRGKSKIKTYVRDINNVKDLFKRIDFVNNEQDRIKMLQKIEEHSNTLLRLKTDLKLNFNN
ncbi:ParB/RepB/Spo0J family partition protein [Paenibacillus xylanexedens]|uniref:ParB/RepB/Spo0J family partition protein n=1 Tax=Paenibacillus xylanexedens TaxID=528191 RepID=UPI00119F61CE|nr:ParB/RepB/Spo0J family partition protein [Paenibacillus xylanexedens]